MHVLTRCTFRLLTVVMALIALGATVVPAPAAWANEPTPIPAPTGPRWPGWALRVTFPVVDPTTGQRAPQVIYTTYTFVEGPPIQVTGVITDDISADCTSHGVWNYDGAYAIFDGTSNYIECDVPAWRDRLAAINPNHPVADPSRNWCPCSPGSAASGAANVKLAPGTRSNPLIDASELGIALSLPSSGGQVQTRLALSSGTYSSPQRSVAANGNRVVVGMNGPTMAALDNYFRWMPYLNPSWKPWFEANVVGPQIGHKIEPSNNTWQGPAGGYLLPTTAGKVYIGRNASGTSFFKGKLADGIVDPPCKGT